MSERCPYDLRTGLTQNVDEYETKKVYDARTNCKHISRSPRSPMTSKTRRKNRRPKIRTVIRANIT